MKFKPLPKKEILLKMVYYKNGNLYWKEGFQWGDKRKPHSKLGTILNTGYSATIFLGERYQVHRLIWFYFHGHFYCQLDHINGDKLDNRIENLRLATNRQNSWNRKPRKTKTGFTGVYYQKYGLKKFGAEIRLQNGERKYLGVYLTAEEASLVYQQELKITRGEWCRK